MAIMRAISLVLFVLPAFAADPPLGRYQGIAVNRRPDGTQGQTANLYAVFKQEGAKTVCAVGTDSFDRQLPCEDVIFSGNRLRFSMPFGGGVIFDLTISGDMLTGTLASKPGVPQAPFNTIELRKTASLALADQVPLLDWEAGERSPLVLRLRKDLSEGRSQSLTEFRTKVEQVGSPLIEAIDRDTESFLATFVWIGASDTENVLLVWPRLSFARPDEYFFAHVPGTDLWFKTLKVRRGTRIYYQVSPNDPLGQRPIGKWQRKAQADPLNKNLDIADKSVPLHQVRSLLELPGASPQPWYAKRTGVPQYARVDEEIVSKRLSSTRKIFIYTPPDFQLNHIPYPSIYLTDGEDPEGLVFAASTFENLLAEGRIPPLVVIRIVNTDQETRNRELACDAGFLDFMNAELVPFVRRKYNTSADPSKTAFGGYSLGGLAAAYAGLHHPETFGLILSQSGSYWFEPTHKEYAEPNWVAREFAQHERLPLRFYMDAGTNEMDLSGNGGGILVTNRQFRDVLRAKGYEVTYREFIGDHDYINWRGTLAEGLIALFAQLR